jgi:tRNA(Arg) A34 adenosine deaminase TadA
MQNATKKQKRYIYLATRMAHQSVYKLGKFSHGAILVKGGNVLNASYNKNSYCSFGNRFRNPKHGNATLHAEIGTVLGLDRSVTRGSSVYVVRLNKNKEYKLSKPCEMCCSVLRHCGVSRVFYSTNEQSLECMRL